METQILTLTNDHIEAVDRLMKRNSGTLGFLPEVVLEEYLNKGGVLGALTHDGQLAGYLLFSANRDRFRIYQLCVSEQFRNSKIARTLVEGLKAAATTQKVIRLNCRNDFPAHSMWPKLGFVPIEEKPGRSKEGHLLTIWRLSLAAYDQLELFRANVSDDVLDVVIDAQILFDFDEPEDDNSRVSKALLSDAFVESVNLWFTDELYVEISRNTDDAGRREARDRAGEFWELKHDPLILDNIVASLKTILPSGSDNQLSDIQHLAKAASSEVRAFVTRDKVLLKKAREIGEMTNLRVLSPTELILRLKEFGGRESATAERVSGLGLLWRQLTASEFRKFPVC